MESFHNICAVDIGSWTTKIAALTNTHRFQILVNQANFRETPSVVAFTDAQRLIGDEAVIKMKSNFKNTVRSPNRLIGLGRKPHILQQQMKYSPVKYRVSEGTLLLQIQQNKHTTELQPQQIMIALMTKIKTIYQNNSINSDFLFISVQTYLNNGERKALKTCAQATGFKNVNLIEQWECIAAQYFFMRQQEIQARHDEIVVIFVDLGYTNFCVHAVSISKHKIHLIDQEVLRYTGAKNIDNLLTQFYIDLIQKQAGKDVRQFPKALVKLQEAVEVQRKKLSANTQNQLTIQCLIGDYDLHYNMKRQQLQDISMPVLADYASAMQNLRSRVQPLAPIHSIQVLGGFSRMPFTQQIIRTVFNQEPSKKTNASQSVARGCSIAAASRLGMLRNNMCNFVRLIRLPIYILIHTISTDGKVYGRNEQLYKQCERKQIFDKTSILPANTIVKIEGEGPVQVLICKEGHYGMSLMGYLNFKGPDNLTILIDNDGIMRARLMKQTNFDDYDLGDLITVEKSIKFKQEEEKMRKRDNNILLTYQIRNQFQSILYNTRQNLKQKWAQFCPPEEKDTIMQLLFQSEEWLSNTEQHTIQNFKERIETISMLTQIINGRRAHSQRINNLRKIFNQHYHTIEKLHHSNPEKLAKLNDISKKFVELYNNESTSYWEGTYLNEKIIKEMIQSVEKLK